MMQNNILNTKKLGYKFYFQDGDNQIACFGSFFTGKEEVYINDDLASSKRSVGFKSKHKFKFAENDYQIEYEMKNILTGRLTCTFLKNKHLIKQQEQTSISFIKDPKKAVLLIGGCFLVGFLSGIAGYIFLSVIMGG
ncbi:MAG: hypothetical protein ACJAXM_001717 [Arenicella sp.]|jgi:hypothetical protein